MNSRSLWTCFSRVYSRHFLAMIIAALQSTGLDARDRLSGTHFEIDESAVSQLSCRFAGIAGNDRRIMKRSEKLNQEPGLANV